MLKSVKTQCVLVLMIVLAAPISAQTTDTTKSKNGSAANNPRGNDSTSVPANATPSANPASDSDINAKLTALLDTLLKKGTLSRTDVSVIQNASSEVRFQLLVELLERKGILSSVDLSASPNAKMQAAIPPKLAETNKSADPLPVLAITPIRVEPLETQSPATLPGLKIGPVTFTPYGFIKATAAHDSSSPNGDDFPIPGGLMLLPHSNTGPNADPEFHIKARQSRIGANIQWPDISSKLVLTGRIEADFEGNFNESDNADVTSIRNPNPRLRLAYVRLDYRRSDSTSLFFVGGQDWTIFGSKAIPNMLDTTWNAADFGAVFNRTPQFRFGVVQTLGDSSRKIKISPEFAIQMPASGQIEKLTFCTLANLFCNGGSPTTGLLNQIGEAERQGADSDRPEIAAGLTLQFQLDKAPSVPPAQLIWTGFFGKRTSVVTNGATDLLGNPYPTALVAGTPFANGYSASSDMYGNQVVVQLPTRWFTLMVSAYRGADLREVLGGQLTTNYTNATGLTPAFLGTGVDNVAGTLSGFAMLGCTGPYNAATASCSGKLVVAPEHGVRAYGGFAEIGLPLSRWFNANPKGHNGGWQLYLRAGKDQIVHRDAAMQLGLGNAVGPNQFGQALGIPMIGSAFVGGSLYYKLNQWCTFAFEQSHYGSRAVPELGAFWTIGGKASRIWQNQREEFGPVFTF